MNYIRHDNAVRTLYQNLDGLLDSHLLDGKDVVMFGTSNIASIIIYYLRQKGINISAIVDNDAARRGKCVYGAKVYLPEEYLLEYSADKIILIASTYQDEMINQLDKMGYKQGVQVFKALDLPKVMDDYSFADRTGYTPLTQEEVKKSQLGILQKLHEVCTKNDIRYFICGGTLIGAVRHKGYIPWDDDIDVVMPMKDIVKLANVLKNDPDYSLISFADDIDYFDVCSLMVDNHTVCDFNGFMQLTSGVSIDVFPFIGVPGDEKEFDDYISKIRRLEMNKWNKLYDPKECHKASDELIEYMLSFDYDKYDTIGNVLGRYFIKDIFPRYYFEETVQLPFENLMLNAPKHWDEYLTKLYGDYMQLPPVEKRVGVHYYRAYRGENLNK